MTQLIRGGASGDTGRCRWCRRTLPERSGPGRPQAFCSGRCRQAAWVSGRRSEELDLSESELIVARADLERLYDQIDVVSRALEDTDRDLARAGEDLDPVELRRILDWLIGATRALTEHHLGPA